MYWLLILCIGILHNLHVELSYKSRCYYYPCFIDGENKISVYQEADFDHCTISNCKLIEKFFLQTSSQKEKFLFLKEILPN